MLVPYGAHITISITLLTTEHSQILTMDMLTVNKYLLLSIEKRAFHNEIGEASLKKMKNFRTISQVGLTTPLPP